MLTYRESNSVICLILIKKNYKSSIPDNTQTKNPWLISNRNIGIKFKNNIVRTKLCYLLKRWVYSYKLRVYWTRTNKKNYSSWTWIRLFLTIVLVSVKFIWYCNFNLWLEILVLLPNRKYIILRFKRRFLYHVYFYILRFIWTIHSLQETMSECRNLNVLIGVWNFSFSLNNVIVYHPMVSFLEYICIAFICPLFACRLFFFVNITNFLIEKWFLLARSIQI